MVRAIVLVEARLDFGNRQLALLHLLAIARPGLDEAETAQRARLWLERNRTLAVEDRGIEIGQWAIITWFSIELVVAFACAADKRRFVANPWRWLDLATVLLALGSLLPSATGALRSAACDGFSLIGRAGFMKAAFQHFTDRGIIHHGFDSWLGALAARQGLEVWFLPVRCHHAGGMSAVAAPEYQRWAGQGNSFVRTSHLN